MRADRQVAESSLVELPPSTYTKNPILNTPNPVSGTIECKSASEDKNESASTPAQHYFSSKSSPVSRFQSFFVEKADSLNLQHDGPRPHDAKCAQGVFNWLPNIVVRFLGVHRKFVLIGLITFLFIVSACLFFTATAVADFTTLAQRKSYSIEIDDRAGTLKYPYIALCNYILTDPGMQASWFQDIKASAFKEWYGANPPPPSPVVATLIPANIYGRKGSCLAIDSGDVMVYSNFDYIQDRKSVV